MLKAGGVVGRFDRDDEVGAFLAGGDSGIGRDGGVGEIDNLAGFEVIGEAVFIPGSSIRDIVRAAFIGKVFT